MEPAALYQLQDDPPSSVSSFEVAVVDPCPVGVPPEPGRPVDQVELDVTETDDAVIVSARVPVPRGVACSFRLDVLHVPVELARPFGERVLLDGRFDSPRRPTLPSPR